MAQVAYASAGGFAAVRNFDRQEEYRTRTEQRRVEREAARADQRKEILELNAFRRTAPAHCRGLEPFSQEWFDACNAAFCAAMRANPDVRPSAGALQLNSIGTAR